MVAAVVSTMLITFDWMLVITAWRLLISMIILAVSAFKLHHHLIERRIDLRITSSAGRRSFEN